MCREASSSVPVVTSAPLKLDAAEAVRRLAHRFPIADWSLDTNGIAGLLGSLEENEADLLLDLGLIGSADAAGVLAFLEAHGAEWTRIRLEKQMADLRRQLRRQEFLAGIGITEEDVRRTEVELSERIADAEASVPRGLL